MPEDWDIRDFAPSKEIARYSDEAMFTAEPATDTVPRARLLDAPNDPLGKLAFLAKAYQGKFPESYTAISDADREYYIQDMEKNILGMPSEAVMFHFVFENVTRSFTHQLVRTRHASYAQESMRFAVKEDFPVQLPAHLRGTLSLEDWWAEETKNMIHPHTAFDAEQNQEYIQRYASDVQRMRFVWDEGVEKASDVYAKLIDMGLPAEDARGLAPHAIVTKINVAIDLRALMQMAGQRLCTQAQWEHREIWASILNAIHDFGERVTYRTRELPRTGAIFSETGDHNGDIAYEVSSAWQYQLLANRFKPVCYQTGSCAFQSDFDRYCNIRDRVQANAAINRPSSEWHTAWTDPTTMTAAQGSPNWLGIPAIHPREWLDPNAAIQKTGDWRSEEARKNIEGRR